MKEVLTEPEFVVDEEPTRAAVAIWDAVAQAIHREYELRQDASEMNLGRDQEMLRTRGFLKELLDTLDTRIGKLVRAFRDRQAQGEELSQETETWLKRIESFQNAVDTVLRNYGVSVCVPSGVADPHRDEVFERIPDSGAEPGTIVKVIKNAYLWRGEVLSPSVVCTAE